MKTARSGFSNSKFVRNIRADVNPRSFSSLVLWYKADTGVFSDAGTTPAVNNDAVQQWNDQSGNGYHLSAGNPPTFKTNFINGKPTIRFDGVNDFMDTATFASAFTQPNTIFVAVNLRNTANTVICDGTNSAGRTIFGREVSASNGKMEMGTVPVIGFVDSVPTNFSIFSLLYNTSNSSLFKNSILKDSGTVSSDNMANLRLAAIANSPNNYADMDISEFIVYNRLLSTSERISIQDYLNNKYTIY